MASINKSCWQAKGLEFLYKPAKSRTLDLSGKNNVKNFNYVGNPVVIADESEPAMYWNGSQYMTMGGLYGKTISRANENFTISLIYKPTSFATESYFISGWSTAGSIRFAIGGSATSSNIIVNMGNGIRTYTSAGITLNAYNHLIFTRDAGGNVGDLYLNGNLLTTYTGALGSTAVDDTGDIYVSTYNSAYNLTGFIKEVRFYSRKFSSAEAIELSKRPLDLYTNKAPVLSIQQNLIIAPSLFTNSNTFYSPTIGGLWTIEPSRFDNTNTFYTQNIVRVITPAVFNNTNVFYGATLTSPYSLTPSRFNNTNGFYTQVVTSVKPLLPSRFDSTNIFYTPVILGTYSLTPSRFNSVNGFYTQVVTSVKPLLPSSFNNTNSFYTPVVTKIYSLVASRFDNTNTFYTQNVVRILTPNRFNNSNVFYPFIVSTLDLYPVRLDNSNIFYSPSLSINGIYPWLFINQTEYYQATLTGGLTTVPFYEIRYIVKAEPRAYLINKEIRSYLLEESRIYTLTEESRLYTIT